MEFVLLQLCQLIVVAALIYFYVRTGHEFLKFGAIALGINLVFEVTSSAGLLSADGIAEAGFDTLTALMIGYAALDLAARKTSGTRLVTAALVLFLTSAAVVSGAALPSGIEPVALGTPAALLFLFCATTAISANSRSVSMLLFVALTTMAAVASVSLHYLPEQVFWQQLLLLTTGIALILVTSERALDELGAKERRIERFAQDRKRLELQISQAQKLESLGMLAGGIAHDFNNMLTSILGYANLAMKKLPPDSEVRKDLYMVMSGARQAVDLTSQMLTYAGKGAIDYEAVDISRVVDNLSSLIHSIVPKHVQLVQRLSRDLPSMKGDRVQLGQAVMNLIANAVDAIEEGAGTVEVVTGLADVNSLTLSDSFFAEELEPGAYLYLKVRDTGIGMSDEQVARIFDPFYSDKGSSKGLGLASLSGIVRQHRGCIRVQSRRGEGSEFIVYFPIVAVSDAVQPSSTASATNRQERGKVLLADDDPRIRSLMVSILESDHYTIISAEDGKEALALWREHQGDFDVLVLDCTMPKMSGTEVYSQIRSEGVMTPAVLVSGYRQEQVARNIENDPNARFIKKPFNVDDFLSDVGDMMRRETRKA